MPMESPFISVVVSSYNYEHYLPRLLESLLKQTYTNWECIIVDDESTDNTSELLKQYSEKDERIKYQFQNNTGPAAARSLGVSIAKGEYVQFIDADDFIGESKFEIEIELFKNNPLVDIVYSSYSFIDSDLKEQWKDGEKWQTLSTKPFNDFVKYWENGLMIPIHSFLFKRHCFEKWGSFDLKLKTHEDWDLNLNFSLQGMKYLHHNYVGAFYRIHLNSSSRTDLTANRKDTLNVLAKYMSKQNVSFFQKCLIINRYFEFFANFLIERIKYKRINFLKLINNNTGTLITVLAFIVFPIYFMKKLITKTAG
jgi:glycosyltransferase involved in cell wall biosynthesis